jgi:hypothetical protein
MRITVGAFSASFRSAGTPYSYLLSGLFASTNAASGTIQVTPAEGASAWCLSATINWTATKQ